MSGLDMAKKPNGRKKIEIAHMQNEKNLNVTFSKRRNGLFKKASEISILCGAEVTTPHQNAYVDETNESYQIWRKMKSENRGEMLDEALEYGYFYEKLRVYSIGTHTSIQLWIGSSEVNPPPDVVVPNTSSKPHQNAYVDETNKELSDMEEKMKEVKNRGGSSDEALECGCFL
ncbi:hypothetical protein HAX54_012172 [Datura stramonium]|uniref:MADS-box domain-containing protein n=1 Tax=Datura stramonium TaxID=4076 RepID=A0ABS8TL53_DATST|nr:hypothetical protein [Datura stramonium]